MYMMRIITLAGSCREREDFYMNVISAPLVQVNIPLRNIKKMCFIVI